MGDFLKGYELDAITGTTVDATRAKLLIDMAEGNVRAFCGWNLSEETVTEQSHDGGSGLIFLPTMYLTAVSAVVENGTTLTHPTHYTWKRSGLLRRVDTYWYDDVDSVVVTYTHGYAKGSPEFLAIKQVVLAVVSRLVASPDPMLSSVQVGGITEAYAVSPQIPSGLLYAEQGALAPFALPSVA